MTPPMKTIPLLPLVALAAILNATPTLAEELLVKAIANEPANAAAGLPRPTRGMSMSAVEQRFGAPQERFDPVGTPGSRQQPPITRWAYPGYSVYFENDRVLTSVVHR